MHSKRLKRYIALFLLAALLPALAACGGEKTGWRSVDAGLGKRVLAVGCREGDPLLDILSAALKVLEADGTVARLSQSWFGRDICELESDANALTALAETTELPESRVLILGYDASSLPFAGKNADDDAAGFEIELAESACALLGWELRTLAIDAGSAAVELAAGDVDCVWGGMAVAGVSGVRAVSYISTDYVLVSRAAAPVSRVSALEGKALSYPPFAAEAASAAGLLDQPETAAKLADTAACFAALNAGRCDAFLSDALSAAYYTK